MKWFKEGSKDYILALNLLKQYKLLKNNIFTYDSRPVVYDEYYSDRTIGDVGIIYPKDDGYQSNPDKILFFAKYDSGSWNFSKIHYVYNEGDNHELTLEIGLKENEITVNSAYTSISYILNTSQELQDELDYAESFAKQMSEGVVPTSFLTYTEGYKRHSGIKGNFVLETKKLTWLNDGFTTISSLYQDDDAYQFVARKYLELFELIDQKDPTDVQLDLRRVHEYYKTIKKDFNRNVNEENLVWISKFIFYFKTGLRISDSSDYGKFLNDNFEYVKKVINTIESGVFYMVTKDDLHDKLYPFDKAVFDSHSIRDYIYSVHQGYYSSKLKKEKQDDCKEFIENYFDFKKGV